MRRVPGNGAARSGNATPRDPINRSIEHGEKLEKLLDKTPD